MAVKKTQPNQMRALNRKPDLSPRRSMELEDGTKIEVIGITARRMMEIVNNNHLTDAEKGFHHLAARILVNGQPIVYDDLLDGFTDDEASEIMEFVTGEKREDGEKNEQ